MVMMVVVMVMMVEAVMVVEVNCSFAVLAVCYLAKHQVV